MANLAWYVGRAATMSPREMAWRAGRAGAGMSRRGELRKQSDAGMLRGSLGDWEALLKRFREGVDRPVLLDLNRAHRIAAARPAETAALIAEADRLRAGERTYFGYPSVDIGSEIDWHRDPRTGYRWPAVGGGSIDHRTAPSDPKWIWELNRLQHLPLLAQAWLFTGDHKYAETAFGHLDSWLTQNPVGTGIAWRGAFEAGLRAISVAVALQGLRTSPAMTTQRYRRVVRMLDASARYCWQGRSRFSSANNHLVGELTGLVTVHLLLPELAAPASFFTNAVDALAAEADRQILPDGAGAEQSVGYQILTAELLSLVVVLSRLRGDDPPRQLTDALERSSNYLFSVIGTDDPDPRYGDDDDGFALRLGAEPKRSVRQHLGIAAAAIGSTTRVAESTLTAAWYATSLGHRSSNTAADAAQPVQAGAYAPDGGLVVLRSGRRRLTMDVGPLGYLSIAAHGHADALSVTLSAEGRDLIVDPGTASYYGNPAWRAAQRGTRVHPTVCIDDLDQSEIGGPFFWTKHAETTVRSVDLGRGIVDAEHNGYCRLDDPVVHRRWLIATPGDATVVVIDVVDARSAHDVAVSWPLHPDLDWTPTANGHLVTCDDSPVLQLCYAATASLRTDEVKGDDDSQLGWWSDRLESRTPSWLLGARCRSVGPVAVLTLMRTGDAGAISDPAISVNAARMTVTWSEAGANRGLTIDRVLSGAIVRGPSWRPERVVTTP